MHQTSMIPITAVLYDTEKNLKNQIINDDSLRCQQQCASIWMAVNVSHCG